MTNKKKALIGAGVAVAGITAATVISGYVSDVLLRTAIDRDAPKVVDKMRKKISGATTVNESVALLHEKAKELEENVQETVELISRDGETLVGHWYPCEDAERVIVAMHGWRSAWSKDFGVISQFWHENGCSVLFAEQRGQNNSSGEYMTFGLMERYDCADWVHWVNDKTGADLPIYLCGVSMGASTVLMASELNLPENVRGIIADCGFTSPHAIWKHVVKNNLHLSYGIRGNIVNTVCKKRLGSGSKEFSTLQALENNQTPVLFIHGAADRFIPVEMTYENYQACKAPKRLLIVPGARHGLSYCVDKEAYERTTKEFWREFDAYEAPKAQVSE